MTTQTQDLVVYQGKVLTTRARPLDKVVRQSDKEKFVSTHSGNWSGYVPWWLVTQDKLYLMAVQGLVAEGDKFRDGRLSDLMPGSDDIRLAEWFSGEMDLNDGEPLASGGYGPSVHERTIRLYVDQGNVVHSKVIDNRQPSQGADAPDRADYPMTASGHGAYEDAWAAWRRCRPRLENIPMAAIHKHRAAMALAQQNGWNPEE